MHRCTEMVGKIFKRSEVNRATVLLKPIRQLDMMVEQAFYYMEW